MTTQHQLTHITMTGVDDSTDLCELDDLSERFPLVEWGFLYSPKRQGQGGRYPAIGTMLQAFQVLAPNVRVALHVCGEGVPNLLAFESEMVKLVNLVASRGGRVQLNFNQSRDALDPVGLSALLDRFASINVITQHNEANEDVWLHLRGHPNHAVLFDASGGRGVAPSTWPSPLPGKLCGYAGGLGPDSLAAELPRIRTAANGQPHWIDMEAKLRSQQDSFDLKRVESCLIQAMTCLYLGSMSAEEVIAAVRFCETCDDNEGYVVPRPMMRRLETLGLVKDKRFGRFEQTSLLLDIREALEASLASAPASRVPAERRL